MSTTRFIQMHFLTSYPAALLNRDDLGFAKRIPFGGMTRTRISSQCLKRHWRTYQGENALSQIAPHEASVRSRLTFERFIYEPLVKDGLHDEIARTATSLIMAEVLGESAKAKKAKSEDDTKVVTTLGTGQLTVLGQPELDYLLRTAQAISGGCTDVAAVKDAAKKHFTKEWRDNLHALKRGAGLDAALFGRMVTSDILARCDAALHVAHAFTVHAEAAESDYFSAVDDLLQSGDNAELGSAHIGTAELTSGLFYGYVVADVPLLISNLAQDRAMAAEVLERLVHVVATVSPGAKLGSTAPHAYAQCVVVETGNAQPRTLANAFLQPVHERPDLLSNAYTALADHLRDLDAVYGKSTRKAVALGPKQALGSEIELADNLATLATWTASPLRGDA